MDVFVGNLSPRTTLSDLVTFFKSFSSDTRFQIHDKQFADGSRTRYAIASIEPDKLAQKAIKKLNGGYLHGNTVVLREFLYRSYNNERRAIGWRDRTWQGVERRDSERRRKQQTPKPADFDTPRKEDGASQVKVEARDLFARKY